jgi:hypothetical protein
MDGSSSRGWTISASRLGSSVLTFGPKQRVHYKAAAMCCGQSHADIQTAVITRVSRATETVDHHRRRKLSCPSAAPRRVANAENGCHAVKRTT